MRNSYPPQAFFWAKPNSDDRMVEQEVTSEHRGRPDYEKTFKNHVYNTFIDALGIEPIERRTVKNLLESAVGDKISQLMQEYLHSQLEILANSVKDQLDVDKSIQPNWSFASHAKFLDILEAAKKKKGCSGGKCGDKCKNKKQACGTGGGCGNCK